MRKRRTRSHIIADLSANHVERFALLCGHSVERMRHDYVQAHFQQGQDFELSLAGNNITVHIDRSNIVDEAAIRLFAHFKAEILRQRSRGIHYEL